MKLVSRIILGTAMAATAFTSLVNMARAEGGPLGVYAGEASIFVNDTFGDRHDRWRTASSSRSWFWDESLLGRTLELRFRDEIISPWTKTKQGPANDRIYANAIGLGAFTHGSAGRLDYVLGAEILVTGDQTGLWHLQGAVHDALGLEKAYDPKTRKDRHLENGVHGLAAGEVAMAYDAGNHRLRPYLGAGVGYESTVTAGVDYFLGPLAGASHLSRDPVTGTPLAGDRDATGNGWSLVAGLDATRVFDSIYLPSDGDVTATRTRLRARAGIQADLGRVSVFFGQAWLSEEFVTQAEPQRTGLLSVDFRF
ncbi:lipid A deacylase LpxR family protein [Defluviimonas salinarum]|uniref:Lipid A deacylase LpxR family protein n=1 Tax=Defluviimonas salinarum TaxID=2992147 RepID=A0ABT3J758_9RHOB|nr:lipid A deacylase LpxR family protein [Defluviimonas salinarum]MCW3783531.1 lipid A deacylase LpxR family protein [Defluviimonas salinarum]